MTILIRLDLQLLLCHKYYVIFIKHESILAKLILLYKRHVFLFCAQDSFMKLF